jgi:hypothetical protein
MWLSSLALLLLILLNTTVLWGLKCPGQSKGGYLDAWCLVGGRLKGSSCLALWLSMTTKPVSLSPCVSASSSPWGLLTRSLHIVFQQTVCFVSVLFHKVHKEKLTAFFKGFVRHLGHFLYILLVRGSPRPVQIQEKYVTGKNYKMHRSQGAIFGS